MYNQQQNIQKNNSRKKHLCGIHLSQIHYLPCDISEKPAHWINYADYILSAYTG